MIEFVLLMLLIMDLISALKECALVEKRECTCRALVVK